MRTTLKKARGRAVAPTENGRAVFPPAVVTPVTRYRQPDRRPGAGRLILRVGLWLLAVMAVAAGGLAAGLYVYAHETLGDVAGTSPELVKAERMLDLPVAGAPATALVVGYDRRLGPEAEVTGRSDTVMLLRADPDRQAVSMLSFPRDLVVEIRCPGRPPFPGRINEAYSACGVEGSLETVRALTGIPINYLVTVNFRGFKQVVAKLGGVWIDVDRRYFNDNSGWGERYATIDLQPGYQKLNGSDALDFVRYRHTDSDLYRHARQQLFVQSFKQAVTTSFSPTRLPEIVRVVTENVRVGAPGSSFSLRTVLSYGLFAYRLPDGRFFRSRIDPSCYGEDDVYAITVDQSCIQQAVNEFANPDVEAPVKATAAALGRKLKQKGPLPRDITVVVLNGNGVPGIAADTAYGLARLGYRTLAPAGGAEANAPRMNYERTTAYFDPAQPKARAAAEKLVAVAGGGETAERPREIARLAGGAMVALVLGRNFGSLAAEPADRTPERKPPAVTRNPAATIGLLRSVQPRLPFPLMVPTVLERTSAPAYDTPIRVYQVAGRRSVRLTFATGASEYWGIQMMRWRDAPALEQPNTKVTLGGRTYELHYSGPHLRMVVLRGKDGTSYWVVNTLVNSLSNETMLAIARGLRPLNSQ